jgi:hypothetical protein
VHFSAGDLAWHPRANASIPSLTPAKGAAEMPSIITVRLSAIGCSVGIALASHASVIPIASVPAIVAVASNAAVITVGSDTPVVAVAPDAAVITVGSDTPVVAVASDTSIVAVGSMNAVIGVMPMHAVGDSMARNGAVIVITSFGYANRAH